MGRQEMRFLPERLIMLANCWDVGLDNSAYNPIPAPVHCSQSGGMNSVGLMIEVQYLKIREKTTQIWWIFGFILGVEAAAAEV